MNFEVKKPSVNSSDKETLSSREQFVAMKFSSMIDNGKFPDLALTYDNIEKIKAAIIEKGHRLFPGDFKPEEVIIELKKMGVIKLVVVAEAPKIEKVVEIYKPESAEKIKGITQGKVSGEQLGNVEANLLWEEAHKREIFKNSEDLNETHEKALALGESKGSETIEDYLEFDKAGLIKPKEGLTSKEVVEKDFKSIGERQNQFKEEAPKDPILYKRYIEAKQIATIVERCLAYCCTNGWYGERVRIVLTSLFDDIKRGVDEVFLIEKDNEKHDVLGLGVDATFRGLRSKLFKEKFVDLLKSIKKADHKTKIKYFKDHNGKMMREFSIPKIVLYFDIDDVKEFFDIVKSVSDEGEKEKIMNSYLKKKVINQIISSCKIMAKFAEDSHNSIFKDYYNVINSIKELSWENEEMRELIKVDENDEVSQHLKFLVQEFREIKE